MSLPLPPSWVSAPLEDLADLNSRHLPPGVVDDTQVSFVPMASVEEGTGRMHAREIRRWGDVRKGYTRFQEGDVLFAKITPCMENGKVALARGLPSGLGAGSTEFHVVRPRSGLHPSYLLQYLLQARLRSDARLVMKGAAGQLRVPATFLAGLELPFPPVAEQRRIVAAIEEHLSRLGGAVAALERVRAALPRYRAAVLKAACEGRLVETEAAVANAHARVFENGEEFAARIARTATRSMLSPAKNSLPAPPTGWTWSTFAALGTLDRGKSRHRPRDDARLYGGRHPFIQTGDVKHSHGVIRNYSQTYSELGLAQSKMWPVGTLCITIAANIADTGILSFPACFPDSVVGFVHEGDRNTVRFIELFLRTVKGRMERYAPATAQKNINLQILRAIAVPVPPLAEQHRIVAEVDRRFSLTDAAERAVSAGLAKAKRLRQAILKRAFEGRLVPQDPSDEPASVLLERIRAERGARRR